MISLAKTIKKIERRIPRLTLSEYPTPLHHSKHLPRLIGGPKLWFKRDDLITFGFGGNKIRALEVIAHYIQVGTSDVIVTGAGIQSNHVRASAALASFLGIDMTAVFWSVEPKYSDGNYRMTRMLGATPYFTNNSDRASVDLGIDEVVVDLRRSGRRPYKIPRGGACPEGVLGHVLAVCETVQQCQLKNINPDTVIMATGSGGTHAGWLLGVELLGLNWQIRSFSVSRSALEAKQKVAQLASKASELINYSRCFEPENILIDDQFIGDGYGVPSELGKKAIELVAGSEGILLDPTYTGKAMAGYLDYIKQHNFNECQEVLFIHTGGEPAFFSGQGEWLNF